MATGRRFCFTLNNYTEEEEEKIKNYGYWTYIIYGREKGENGVPHLQGYCEANNSILFKTLKKLSPRTHWEVTRGTGEQASQYCKKDGDFYERGEMKKRCTMKNIEQYRELVKAKGMSGLTNLLVSPSVNKTFKEYLTYNEEKRNWKPYVEWIYGESGTGKTAYIMRQSTEEEQFWKDSTKWWDGYDKHPVLVLDDFRAHWMKFTYLLKVLDRYQARVETKGGYRQLLCRKIFITTLTTPECTYNMPEEPIKQLIRRIDKIIPIESVNTADADAIEYLKDKALEDEEEEKLRAAYLP